MRFLSGLTGGSSPSTVVRTLVLRALWRCDEEAARQIGQLGVSAVQLLVDAFPRRRHPAALMLHTALARMERLGTTGTLRELRIQDASFAPLLADRRGLVRSVAARIVGLTGNRLWVPVLTRLLADDHDPFVRTNAAEALGRLAAVETIPLLVDLVERPHEPARYHALRALGLLGPAAWRHLSRMAFEHPEDTVRRVAAETIARVADATTWSSFLERLSSTTAPEVRKTAIAGLGRSGVDRAAAPLERALLGDPSPFVREAAADAFVAFGEPCMVAALATSVLHDPYWIPDANAHRCTTADGEPNEFGRVYPVREAAADALSILGGARA
jgi:HEAT repeat protein